MIIAVLDDDIVFAEILKEKILEWAYKEDMDFQVYIFTNPYELEDDVRVYDLLFLDIVLSEHDGIEWMGKWTSTGRFRKVIYVSAYDEHVFRTFQNSPVAFVRKAHLEEDLQNGLNLYKEYLFSKPVQVIIPEGKKQYFFEPSDIVYLCSNKHYIDICLNDGKKVVIREKLERMEEILGSYGFIRIHTRYIVNAKYIRYIKQNIVFMMDENEYRISNKYKNIVYERLKLYMLKKEEER